jgi:hypothetical protein
VGALGATEASLTDVNNRYDLNLFKFLQESSDKSLGTINALAANKIVRDNGGSAPINIKMYILFANPFTELRLGL